VATPSHTNEARRADDTRRTGDTARSASLPDPETVSEARIVGSERSLIRLVTRSHRLRRYARRMLALVVLLLVSVPAATWVHYQAGHVISRNALVRGHLAEIGTRLNGVLASAEVGEGQRVKAGQLLAHLEDRHIVSEAQQAEAEIAGLERELQVEKLKIPYERSLLETKRQEAVANLAAADAKVSAARSRADDAKAYHKVRKELLSRNAISREDVRDADSKRRTAEALLDVAKANYASAQSAEKSVQLEADGLSIREQHIGVLEANIMRAKARLAHANADLEASRIRAPDDGAIVRWLVQPGGSVEVGKPVMSMWVGKDVWIEAWIDEDDISRVRVGSPATVTLQSFPEREFSGSVERLGLTTDFETPVSDVPQPRFSRMRGAPMVGVLIKLDSPPENLLPGLSAAVAIRDTDGN
jgi:multidrug resistance efflux pump